MIKNYLQNVKTQFTYYKTLGEKTFAQVEDSQLFWEPSQDANSITVIVNHLWGNMMSRWTDFLIADGEKEWRLRDREFEQVITNRSEMLQKWNEGWQCLFRALDSVNESNFNKKILIRNQEHTITEAINRQMMHYAYHTGQILFLGKMINGANWESLSIPKGKSTHFNAEKMNRGVHGGHFSEDII